MLSLSIYQHFWGHPTKNVYLQKNWLESPSAGCKKLSDDNNVLYSKETIRRVKSSDQTDVAKLHSNEYIHAHKCLHTHTLQNVAPYIILFLCSPFTCYFAITIEPLNKKSLMIIKSDKHFIRGLSFDCWIYLSSLGMVRMGRSDKLTYTTFTKLPAYLLA